VDIVKARIGLFALGLFNDVLPTAYVESNDKMRQIITRKDSVVILYKIVTEESGKLGSTLRAFESRMSHVRNRNGHPCTTTSGGLNRAKMPGRRAREDFGKMIVNSE
jgi:hypothetical protein